jgi:N utilization substance protein B
VRRDVPARAIINEYVEIAHDFFGGEEPAVVNGVLDRVAREKRQDEFGRKAAKKPG